MIKVREATPADADQLATLNHAFNGVERDGQRIRESLQAAASPETALVADDGGTIVGFLCFQALRSLCYDAPWVEITELYVAPTHRRRGIARALVREAEIRAQQAGASELLLRTNTENAAAQSLFKRIGLDPAPHVVLRRTYGNAV